MGRMWISYSLLPLLALLSLILYASTTTRTPISDGIQSHQNNEDRLTSFNSAVLPKETAISEEAKDNSLSDPPLRFEPEPEPHASFPYGDHVTKKTATLGREPTSGTHPVFEHVAHVGVSSSVRFNGKGSPSLTISDDAVLVAEDAKEVSKKDGLTSPEAKLGVDSKLQQDVSFPTNGVSESTRNVNSPTRGDPISSQKSQNISEDNSSPESPETDLCSQDPTKCDTDLDLAGLFREKDDDSSLEDLLKGKDDEFLCPPCNCSISNRGFIHADCAARDLFHVPSKLPPTIYTLDLSKNVIIDLNMHAASEYPKLVELTVTGCKMLTRITNDTQVVGDRSHLEILDLCFNNISVIEDASFQSLTTLITLTLCGNKIQKVNNLTFVGLQNLSYLDLSMNDIKEIEYGAFDYLTNLKALNLSHNTRFSYSNHHMPPRLFMNLTNLKNLYIHRNSRGDMSYPGQTLAVLKNLRMLSIDGLSSHARLGPEFYTLKKLRRLDFGLNGGLCYITNLTEDFFINTPYLDSIAFDSCHFTEVSSDLYKPFVHLEAIYFSNCGESYDLYDAFRNLKNLQNSSLKSVSFIRMSPNSVPCTYLTKEDGLALQGIPLEELDLSQNHLVSLRDDFTQLLPKTLKRLILKNNAFATKYYILNRLGDLQNLEELDISDQNIDTRHHNYPESMRIARMSSSCSRGDVSSMHHTDYNVALWQEPTDFANYYQDVGPLTHPWETKKQDLELHLPITSVGSFTLPPKLRVLKASKYTNFAIDLFLINIKTKHSLETIDLSQSFMQMWGHGKMMKSIVIADLSENYCKYISRDFFQPQNSLTQLVVNNNFLGSSFADDEEGDIFQALDKLAKLDISTNLIYRLPQKIFQGLVELHYINLSDNKLQILNTTFASNRKLRYIDASKNSISWISRKTRDDLDSLTKHHPVYLDLTLNPLPCTCDGVDVIQWMATTNVTLLNADFLVCRRSDASIVKMGDIEKRVLELQRTCTSQAMVIIVCTCCGTAFLTFLGLSIAYRYRWRLLYLKNVILLRFLGYKPNQTNGDRNDFMYDAYVIHAESCLDFVMGQIRDQLDSQRGHKLCIPFISFMPTAPRVPNIVAAIKSSKTSLVILTPDLAQDSHAVYSIKMALSEEHFESRRALFVVLLQYPHAAGGDEVENNPVDGNGDIAMMVGEDNEERDNLEETHPELTKDLLYVMQRGSAIEFPTIGEMGVDQAVVWDFWDRLSAALGHTSNRERRPYVEC